jgi:predicted dithiol-disulfide oxidoreductase (DUF899 family)
MSTTRSLPVLKNHRVVSHDEWLKTRKELLKEEKAVTHANDALSRKRRELPWEKVEKEYVFEGPKGEETLSDLFEGRSQLIVYHFMFGPDWKEGCPGCSFLCDHIDGANLHLSHHDVTLLAVSRGPLDKLQAFKKRMGWHFKWVSSNCNDFNYDYHVSPRENEAGQGKIFYNFDTIEGEAGELPGISVFYKDEQGNIFHTYSAYARGGDILIGAHNYLDMTPKGRNEEGTMSWMRHHDRYEDAATKKSTCDCDEEGAA